ncbi:substrate-binding domain-containing protein [Streptomyces sp. B6B3]|uniref:sugar ABC transporter substrate-binding protein n=1 Tax=Streptomyces sp. B6B3 TaxID=3153570 RepID=UPI00325E0B80
MATLPHGAAAVACATALVLGLAGCGQGTEPGGADDGGSVHIGLLLPDNLGRWEDFDRPLIEQAVAERCGDCTVEVANAEGDAATQQRQVDSMITGGVDSLIISPIDAIAIRASVERAHEAGIHVVAYDRLAEGPVSAYASFDNNQVGRLQATALVEALADVERPRIVMLNGSPTDPNAEEFAQGAREVFDGRVEVNREYDILDWSRDEAYATMSGAIVRFGAERIDGVYAGNDSIASGAIAALKHAQVSPLPPVTGQDAELAAIQLIVTGEQEMTVYKPFRLEAEPAAEMALALARGDPLDSVATDSVGNATVEHIPAVLATPTPVTVDTIESTVVRDGMFTIDQICTPRIAPACRRAGLTG